jgi:hypothetical protein
VAAKVTIEELKVKLKPAGILLACYFVVPILAQWLLGSRDVIYANITVSDALQACLGGAALYIFFGQEDLLRTALTERLDLPGRPRDKVRELSAAVITSAGYIGIAALLLPPLGAIFPASWLMTLARFAALVYTVYAAFSIWNLSQPILQYLPPAEPPHAHEAHSESAGRCSKCGQELTVSMKVCAFCKQPVANS